MIDTADLVRLIEARAGDSSRYLVAIAGPPASGKSTVAATLAQAWPDGEAIVVPMDGFHFDDIVLAERGLSHRKGAPETFDFAGFEVLLKRIRSGEADIAIPVFDRSIEIARAGAAIIGAAARIVIIEGNYLLLDEAPWNGLRPLFDLSLFIAAPRAVLEQRLVGRWQEHGREAEAARRWIETNDMPNIDRVLARRLAADLVVETGDE